MVVNVSALLAGTHMHGRLLSTNKRPAYALLQHTHACVNEPRTCSPGYVWLHTLTLGRSNTSHTLTTNVSRAQDATYMHAVVGHKQQRTAQPGMSPRCTRPVQGLRVGQAATNSDGIRLAGSSLVAAGNTSQRQASTHAAPKSKPSDHLRLCVLQPVRRLHQSLGRHAANTTQSESHQETANRYVVSRRVVLHASATARATSAPVC